MRKNHVVIINPQPGAKIRCKMGAGNHEAKKVLQYGSVLQYGVLQNGSGDCSLIVYEFLDA